MVLSGGARYNAAHLAGWLQLGGGRAGRIQVEGKVRPGPRQPGGPRRPRVHRQGRGGCEDPGRTVALGQGGTASAREAARAPAFARAELEPVPLEDPGSRIAPAQPVSTGPRRGCRPGPQSAPAREPARADAREKERWFRTPEWRHAVRRAAAMSRGGCLQTFGSAPGGDRRSGASALDHRSRGPRARRRGGGGEAGRSRRDELRSPEDVRRGSSPTPAMPYRADWTLNLRGGG